MASFSAKSLMRILPVVVVLFLFTAGLAGAQQAALSPGPPISAPLVREGDFAAALDAAFGLGNGRDEVAAEDRLSGLGIMPKNGWMADYPVTPDIAYELQQGVITAADTGRLSFARDEALRRLETVLVGCGLIETPYDGSASSYAGQAPYAYPDQAALSGYYAAEGPPVITYYTPPPDYSYLYSYVDYPFWYSGYWLPGFFILRDFHRHDHHHFVSNHYLRPGTSTAYRVNPTARLAGGAPAAPARSFALPRTPTGTPGPVNPAGALGPRNPTGTFGPRNSVSSFSAPPVFSQPRVAMAAPGVRAPYAFSGHRSFSGGSHAPSTSFHSSGGSHGGGSHGGHGGSHGGGGRGGGRR